MPRRNTFIRKEDIEAWDNMPNRPEWLHDRLQEYKNGHMGIPITDDKPPETPADDSAPPEQFEQIIAGIEDADE